MRPIPLLACAALMAAWPASVALAATEACRLRGVEHEARCGIVQRPLDPARPDGPQIDIHYAVLPALARLKKPDPVFFFAGGPGQSTIDLAGPMGRLMARLGNRRDIVLIDQRGTGRSAPLDCEPPDPTAPLRDMADPARQRAELARCRTQLESLPHGDLRQYTTTIAMADADAVRRALGADRVNLVGASYGTRAALEYLRQFPQAVRRVVLDGVAPPDMALPQGLAVDGQAAFDAMAASCAADFACATHYPEVHKAWRTVLASLPRDVTVPHPVTGREERMRLTEGVAVGLLRLPLYVPALASALPLAISDAAEGRFGTLVGLAGATMGRRGALELSQGMHFSVVCAEDVPRMTADGIAQAAARAPDFGDTLSALYSDVCADWPRGQVPAAFYAVPAAPVATLVLSGGIDPVTPPRHGARVTQALGAKARHVVVPNAGHGVMAIGCMRDALYRFVDAESDDDALTVDTACVERIPRPPAFQPVRPETAAAAGAASAKEGAR